MLIRKLSNLSLICPANQRKTIRPALSLLAQISFKVTNNQNNSFLLQVRNKLLPNQSKSFKKLFNYNNLVPLQQPQIKPVLKIHQNKATEAAIISIIINKRPK